jgi:hypothetical protein
VRSNACRWALRIAILPILAILWMPDKAAAQPCAYCDAHSSCTQGCITWDNQVDSCGNWNCDRTWCGEVCTPNSSCSTACTNGTYTNCGQYGVCGGTGGSGGQCSSCNNYSRCDATCQVGTSWSTCGNWVQPCGECAPPRTYTHNDPSDGSACNTGTFTDTYGATCGGNSGTPTWADGPGTGYWYCPYTCVLECPNLNGM